MPAFIKDDSIQQQILQAAKQLFQLHGSRRVTIDDIAKAIGKARSSLYYYYKTKEEILDAVIAAEVNDLMTAIADATSQATTTEEKIIALFLTKLHVIVEKRGFFNSLDEGMDTGEYSAYQKAKLAIHQQIWQRESTILSQIITEGFRSGKLAQLDQTDLDNLVFSLLCSLHGLKREMVIQSDFSQVTPRVQILVRSLINGLKK